MIAEFWDGPLEGKRFDVSEDRRALVAPVAPPDVWGADGRPEPPRDPFRTVVYRRGTVRDGHAFFFCGERRP